MTCTTTRARQRSKAGGKLKPSTWSPRLHRKLRRKTFNSAVLAPAVVVVAAAGETAPKKQSHSVVFISKLLRKLQLRSPMLKMQMLPNSRPSEKSATLTKQTCHRSSGSATNWAVGRNYLLQSMRLHWLYWTSVVQMKILR